MIILFTDFGLSGPYVGQMQAAVAVGAPGVPVINLFADAPAFRIRESAYLLAAHARHLPEQADFLCVVDPGVGSDRPGVALKLDGRWFVGPGNGLFEIVRRRAGRAECYMLPPAGAGASASFHGRDIFAPTLARLSMGEAPEALGLTPGEGPRFTDWPDDWAAVIYVDAYGNLMTGLRAQAVSADAVLKVAGQEVGYARTFSDVPQGAAFWYRNSNDLVEIAVNCGRADQKFGLTIGDPIGVSRLS